MRLKPETIEIRYYSIGTLARKLNCNPSAIRFWCSELDLKPRRSTINHKRQFTKDEFNILARVKELHDTGHLTLKGIKAKLSEESKDKDHQEIGNWLSVL